MERETSYIKRHLVENKASRSQVENAIRHNPMLIVLRRQHIFIATSGTGLMGDTATCKKLIERTYARGVQSSNLHR